LVDRYISAARAHANATRELKALLDAGLYDEFTAMVAVACDVRDRCELAHEAFKAHRKQHKHSGDHSRYESRLIQMDRDLFMNTLRVLTRVSNGEPVDSSSINKVRRQALPDEIDLPLDDLCRAMIRRELKARSGSQPASGFVATIALNDEVD
jgi:hypothetical protein